VISDMLWTNWALPGTARTTFSTQKELDKKFQRRYGVTFDFKGWYYALPTSTEVGRHLVVRVGNKCFMHTRAPMGHKWMVFAAHTFTKVIAWNDAVDTDIIIDNVLFTGDDPEKLREQSSAFLARAERFGATIGDSTDVGTHVVYRGVDAQLGGSVSVKPAWAQKCARRIEVVLTRPPTAAQMWSLGGMFAWLRGIIPLEVLEDYHLWRDIARAANMAPHKLIRLHKYTAVALLQLKETLARAELPRRELDIPVQPRVIVVTDASLARPLGRWGAIVVTSHITALGGLFPVALCRVASIADLEMAAAALTLHLSRGLERRHIALFMDNTAAAHVLQKGRSAAWRLHVLGKDIHASVRALGATLTVIWIPSELNPADGISRGRNPTDEDISKLQTLARTIGMVSERTGLNKGFENINISICESVLLNILGKGKRKTNNMLV